MQRKDNRKSVNIQLFHSSSRAFSPVRTSPLGHLSMDSSIERRTGHLLIRIGLSELPQRPALRNRLSIQFAADRLLTYDRTYDIDGAASKNRIIATRIGSLPLRQPVPDCQVRRTFASARNPTAHRGAAPGSRLGRRQSVPAASYGCHLSAPEHCA